MIPPCWPREAWPPPHFPILGTHTIHQFIPQSTSHTGQCVWHSFTADFGITEGANRVQHWSANNLKVYQSPLVWGAHSCFREFLTPRKPTSPIPLGPSPLPYTDHGCFLLVTCLSSLFLQPLPGFRLSLVSLPGWPPCLPSHPASSLHHLPLHHQIIFQSPTVSLPYLSL